MDRPQRSNVVRRTATTPSPSLNSAGPLVKMSLEPLREVYPCQTAPQLIYSLITLKTQVPPVKATAQNINLCLVVDRSTSMRGDKIEYVKLAASQLVQSLGANDFFTLIVFSDKAEVIVPCQIGANAQEIIDLLQTITPRGGTEIAQGIEAGLTEMRAGKGDNRLNNLILLTDGHTYGDDERCKELALSAQAQQISIAALGVGDEWNDHLLATIANESQGALEFIDRPEKILDVFNAQLERLRNTLVVQTTLFLRKPASIQIRSLFQIIPAIKAIKVSDKDIAVIGNISRNEERTYLLEALVTGPAEPALMPIAELELYYQSAQTPQRTPIQIGRSQPQVRARLEVRYDSEPDQKLNTRVLHALEGLTAHRLQERAWQEAQRGNIKTATNFLTMSATHLHSMGAQDIAQRVRKEAEQLEKTRIISPSAQKVVHHGTRSLQMPTNHQPK